MKHTYLSAAITAALALAGFSAHASCADPRSIEAQASLFKAAPDALAQSIMANEPAGGNSGFAPIVGTWLATYSAGGNAYAQAYIQWHSDGTEWENINFPVLGGNICMGSWKQIDATHFHRNHFGWLYANGNLAGYFNEVENDVISSDGLHYHGTNTTTMYLNDGTTSTSSGNSNAVLLKN